MNEQNYKRKNVEQFVYIISFITNEWHIGKGIRAYVYTKYIKCPMRIIDIFKQMEQWNLLTPIIFCKYSRTTPRLKYKQASKQTNNTIKILYNKNII